VVTGSVLVITSAGAAVAAPPRGSAPTSPSSPAPPSAPATPVPESPSPTATARVQQLTAPTAPRTAAATRGAVPTVAGYQKFYRAAIKRGDVDGDVNHIKHVREVQYRLRWAHVYTGPVTGTFGSLTETAVKKFQASRHLPATGKVDLATWQLLIPASARALSQVPAVCKKPGWHACYNRTTHEAYLYASGVLWNLWLVRGGSSSAQTVLGTYPVFARYLRKTSSLYHTLMLYFQKFHGGEGLHGSVTMIDPFVGHSHGCVNMYIPDAKVLWDMTQTVRLTVTVHGAWS
jgi:hypothetical protein